MPELFVKFIVTVVRNGNQTILDAKRIGLVRADWVVANFYFPVVQILTIEQRDPLFLVRRFTCTFATRQHDAADND